VRPAPVKAPDFLLGRVLGFRFSGGETMWRTGESALWLRGTRQFITRQALLACKVRANPLLVAVGSDGLTKG